MALNTLEELIQTIFQLNLIDPVAFQSCYYGMDFQNDPPEKLLEVLEQRHLLTPYQIGRLEKGDFENLLVGNYRLLYRNDSGSFARVFRAAPRDNDEIIALKILRQRWLNDESMVKHFHREAELCQRLNHENIVPIYEVGVDGENHYFTMEFVEGGNFKDFMKIRKKLSAVEATGYMVQIARALEYALRMGVTHRDLKLSNVLLNTRGVAKLADFGLAGDSDSVIGSRGETPQHALEYATLEKSTGAQRNDPRSDLYFAGTIYYEMLAGKPPYRPTANRDERKNMLRYVNITPIKKVAPEVPKGVVEIVDRLLKVDPSQRYQSASELLADLEGMQLHLGTHTIPGENSIAMPTVKPQTSSQQNGTDSNSSKAGNPSQIKDLESAGKNATILCVENREKMQSKLRNFFTKAGYRFKLVSDPGRAMKMMEDKTPPDCVFMMGEPIGDKLPTVYAKTAAKAVDRNILLFVILASKQTELIPQLEENDHARILLSSLGAKGLQKEIRQAFQQAHVREQQQKALNDSRLIR